MGSFGFDIVTDIPTPVKLMFGAVAIVMIVWVLAGLAFGNRGSGPGDMP